MKHVLIIEPFYGGSHKQLIDFLQSLLKDNFHIHLYTLPAKKWHWRARTSALYFAQNIPELQNFPVIDANNRDTTYINITKAYLFCSSVLNLTELISVRQDIAEACKGKKIIYFHENQVTYPIQPTSIKGERDFQYGYNQVLSALSADKVLFNSKYNLTTFTENIKSLFQIQPDFRPSISDLQSKITKKACAMYFPLNISPPDGSVGKVNDVLHIVWPHRWEHDKNPIDFFQCLIKLHYENYKFTLSVLGEQFTDVPNIFSEAKNVLSAEIKHFGRLEIRKDYLSVLRNADVVVSTANHEFFGVAVIEAAICGCYPLVPNRLVYPEIFDSSIAGTDFACYRTNQQMYKKLKEFCLKPYLAKIKWKTENAKALFDKFSTNSSLSQDYANLFECEI